MLRRASRALRHDLRQAAPDAADRAANAQIPIELTRLRTVGGYQAIGAEIDPHPLLARFASFGAIIALPVARRRDAPLEFRRADDPETFVADAFGILGPPPTAPRLIPDLVIVPLLAFDRRGGRLGQGAGCYDRTLWALRRQGLVFALGLAYAGQEVETAPTSPHDQALDAILTENGYIAVLNEGT